MTQSVLAAALLFMLKEDIKGLIAKGLVRVGLREAQDDN